MTTSETDNTVKSHIITQMVTEISVRFAQTIGDLNTPETVFNTMKPQTACGVTTGGQQSHLQLHRQLRKTSNEKHSRPSGLMEVAYRSHEHGPGLMEVVYRSYEYGARSDGGSLQVL